LDDAGYRRLIAGLGGRHLESSVRALFQRCVEIDPNAVHPGVRPLLVAPYLLEWSPSVPIAPLSDGGAERLENASKASIAALEVRLAEGARMLTKVADPEALGDAELVDGSDAATPARTFSAFYAHAD
jgi:hypothetical protein